jgi:hypothetical protein
MITVKMHGDRGRCAGGTAGHLTLPAVPSVLKWNKATAPNRTALAVSATTSDRAPSVTECRARWCQRRAVMDPPCGHTDRQCVSQSPGWEGGRRKRKRKEQEDEELLGGSRRKTAARLLVSCTVRRERSKRERNDRKREHGRPAVTDVGRAL